MEKSESERLSPMGASAPVHPFVREIARGLTARSRVLVVGIGSGRHLPPLLETGASVDVIEADARHTVATRATASTVGRVRIHLTPFDAVYPIDGAADAALCTHAALHGTPTEIGSLCDAVFAALRPGAPFYLTLGSRSDPRFGVGRRLGDATFAPLTGSEAGVAHSYFDEMGARAILRKFTIASLTEGSAARTVGAWAHSVDEAEQIVHWFAHAIRN